MSSENSNDCENKLICNASSSHKQNKEEPWSDENSSNSSLISCFESKFCEDDRFAYDESRKELCKANNLIERDFSSTDNNWSLTKWPNGSRRSAFQPYKPITVLTNLQRGNIKTETTDVNNDNEITLYEQAGLGELTVEKTRDAGTLIINKADENGLSALMWAAAYGQTSTVNLLITNGAKVDLTSFSGETALLFAAAEGHLDVVKCLIEHDADVNHEDFTGSTALMYAAYSNHPHIVNELLLHGATFSITNSHGDNAYTIALNRDNNLALAVLESHLVTLLSEEILVETPAEERGFIT